MDTTLYTLTTPAGIAGTLMTAPRPLPGRQIGYKAGTGFPVFDIAPEFADEARRLDAQPIVPITADEVAARVEAWAAEAGYDMADVIDAYGDDLTVAFDQAGLGRLIEVDVR